MNMSTFQGEVTNVLAKQNHCIPACEAMNTISKLPRILMLKWFSYVYKVQGDFWVIYLMYQSICMRWWAGVNSAICLCEQVPKHSRTTAFQRVLHRCVTLTASDYVSRLYEITFGYCDPVNITVYYTSKFSGWPNWYFGHNNIIAEGRFCFMHLRDYNKADFTWSIRTVASSDSVFKI